MSTRPDPDAELMEALRAVLKRVDPVPPEVDEFARAALGWRRLDADLAELLADSALESERALTRSGGAAVRSVTFRASDLTIDVEVAAAGDGRTVLGQLAPPSAGATVDVQAADGSLLATAESDALGRFRLVLPTGGRVRLRVLRRDPSSAPIETSWLSL